MNSKFTRNNISWNTARHFNTLRPLQNDREFADDIFECMLLNENFWISSNISLKCVPCGLIDNVSWNAKVEKIQDVI